jgi:phosphotransferase system HPr (HPr) family protein
VAGEPQAVGGISVPLTLDPSGWTAGLRRARADLEQLRREAAQLSSPAAQARRAPVSAGGVGVPAGVAPVPGAPVGAVAAVAGVSPRFNVSQGAVRDMRIEINRQLRTFASQGEAVAIPVKLGRVPYAAFRQELATGIGEVPVKITLDPGAIASLRGQVMRAVGLTAPGSGGPVAGIQRRATGGPAQPGQPMIVGESRAEVFEPTVPGRIRPSVTMQDQMRQRQLDVIRRQLMVDRGSYPQRVAGGLVGGRYARTTATRGLTPAQRDFDANVMAGAGRLQPHNIQGGIDWYRQMREYGLAQAAKYNVPVPQAIGALAALSAGTEWQANKTKFERILQAQSQGKPFPYSMNFDAHRKAQAILSGQLTPEQAFATSPKVGQFYQAGMGNLSSLVVDLWATRTATQGGMSQPGRARPGIEAAFRKGARSVGLQNAEFQAALWLLEKEESKVPPGQMGMGFARGGRIAGQMGMGFAPKFPRSRPFCSLCGTSMANPFDHNATEQHKQNMRRRVGQGGIKLKERPGWMTSLAGDNDDEEYLREKVTTYPGGKWAPGMWRGGRARAYQMTLDQGGGTFDLQGNAPRRGYAVGTAEGTAHLVDDEDRLGFARAFRTIAKSDTPYVGTWHHEGQIHVDPAIVARRKKDALEIARRQRQIAYYDLAHGKDVYTERRETDPVPGQLSLGMAAGGQARMRGAGFVPGLRSIAQGYNRMVGLPRMQEQMLHPLNADFGRRTAAAYEQMPVGPDDLSRQAYKAFGEETAAQYEYLQKAGFRFEPDPGDPYSPKPGDKLTKMQMAAQDVRRNKRLLAFSSSLEHPLLTNEQNLQFRHVHDMMGHLAEGYSIGPRGEFNAAVKHSQMFTPLARRAMLAETHGQNSVVNFSSTVMPGFGGRSIAEVNKAAPGTIYAQQKAQVLPDDILEEFYGLTGIKRAAGGRARFAFNPANTRDLYPTMRETRKEIGRGDWEFGLHDAPPDLAELRRSMGLDNWYNPDRPRFGTDRIEVPPKLNPKVGRGYLFHGTGAENLSSIARRGVIPRTGGANLHGTPWEHEFANDPVSWWETRLRSSFGGGAAGWGEHVLRARQRGLKTDWGPSGMSEEKLLRQTVPPEALEILADDASWRPITSLFKRAGGGPVNKIDILKRLSRTMQPFSGSQFEPFQKPIMLPGQGGGKWIQIDPRWLPKERIDPAFLEKNAAGGPVTKSWRFADPNGLHMRPAAGFARALELANVDVTGRNLSNGQELQNPKSLYSWMTLGARQGHKIELTFDGPDSQRIAKLFGQMMGFNPEKTGMGYHEFQKQLGIGNPATEALEMRMAQASRWDRFKKAGGGEVLKLSTVGKGGRWAGDVRNTRGAANVRPGDLKPYMLTDPFSYENPRYMQTLMNSIRESGFFEPATVTIRGNGPGAYVTDGNHRVAIAELMGLESIPTRFRGPGGRFASPSALGIDKIKKAGGGDANKGRYIVNELGIEKFVPDRLAHQIPPDVASQIPGGGSLMERLSRARGEDQPEPFKPAWMRRNNAKDLTGRAGGGIVEIPGRGPRVWEAPEDGWIIPARLAGKIPTRQAGGYAGSFGGFEEGLASSDAEMQRQRAEALRQRQIERAELRRLRNEANPAVVESRRLRADAAAQSRSLFAGLPVGRTGGGASAFDQLQQAARLSQSLLGGRTARTGLGGVFAGVLGGGQAQRQSLLEGQVFARQYEQFLPKGVPRGTDPILFYGEKLQDLEDLYAKQTTQMDKLQKSGEGATGEIDLLGKSMERTERRIGTAREAISTAGQLQQKAQESFARAQGSATRNILSLTAAGFAYSTAAQALQVGFELATTAAKPFVDTLSGFTSTSTRVTQGLADQARQAGGNIPSAIGAVAGAAGIGPTGLAFLTQTLSSSIAAKAGAAAAQEASDLFRAAAGAGRAPTGLFGGYGGVGGSPFLAELLGGGKGYTEILAGDVAALRAQQKGPRIPLPPAPIEGLPDYRGAIEGLSLLFGGPVGFGATQMLLGNRQDPSQQQISGAQRVLEKVATDYNEAASRGARALDEHTTGLRLATREQLGLTESTDDLQQTQMRAVGSAALDTENAKNLADNGLFLVDATNNLVKSADQYQRFFEQSARGRPIMSEAAFAAQSAQGLRAQRQLGRAQTEFAINTQIPGEAGLQIAAQPFLPAGTGVPRGPVAPLSDAALTNLREANKLQDQLTADSKVWVENMAQFVSQNSGAAQGAQFRSIVGTPGAGPNTTTIAGIGEEIAGITAAVSDQQAAASYAAYANNIRLINRSLSDARGLLSGRGSANNLGVIQRQQFELSRQSQKLSLESQRLQLQSNELQLQLSQRQINFQRAIAGFQAPGITGQERAARMAEAELEASFAQRQLDIGRQQQGIGREQLGISGEQLGLELRAFMEGARRAVVDLEAQRALVTQQYQLEQEQISAQRRINALSVRQGQLQAKASALFAEASGNFNAQLAAGAQYVAQFGGTLAAAVKAIRTAFSPARTAAYAAGAGKSGGAYYPGNRGPHAAGYSAMVDRPTSFIAGEAGSEHVLVIRNPSTGTMGPAGGGGWMGGESHITINISGNQFGANLDETEVARKLADEVESRFETKARLLNVNA